LDLRTIVTQPNAPTPESPEPAWTWSAQKRNAPAGSAYDIKMRSQVWHGVAWSHDIWLRIPEQSPAPDLAVIYFSSLPGGQPLEKAAASNGLASAVLSGVPGPPPTELNKPGVDLMRESMAQYVRTSDLTWVPIYPMTIAAVRAMDTIQAATKDTPAPIRRFVLIGHSKLGYTAWMTAAIDPRVAGIVPMAAQVLNVRQQLKVGGLASHPTVEPLLKAGKLDEVLSTFDPYQYRDRLTMPKLDIAGVRDSLYSPGALAAYLDKLPGASYALALPNVGHGVTTEADTMNATNAFLRALARGGKLPTVQGSVTEEAKGLRLHVTCDAEPTVSRVWTATGPTADLRGATWNSSPLKPELTHNASGNGVTCDTIIDPPAKGTFVGVFAELRFDDRGTSYPLTTVVFVSAGH
jgi:pimeloyl-ACP methyl ester carboxylesterase